MADVDIVQCIPRASLNKHNSILNFYLGEEKIVETQIISLQGKDFTIGTATVVLETLDGTPVEGVSSVPMIDNIQKRISFLLSPPTTGMFNLVVTYTIGLSKLIVKGRVVVR